MADTTALKNRIRAAIKANDNQEITGPVLQQTLLDIVDELNGATETEADARQNGDSTLQQSINTEKQQRQDVDTALGQHITQIRATIQDLLNGGYLFAGIADPAVLPGTPLVSCFYIATEAGTYTNFLDADNEPIVISYDALYVLTYEAVENHYWECNKVSNLGDGVFDISAYHNGQTYATLSDALGVNGNNVPTGLRKSGMSVKFVHTSDNKYVHTSDNKYVQYFLTKDEWSLSEADWQKINLAEEVSQLGQEIAVLKTIDKYPQYLGSIANEGIIELYDAAKYIVIPVNPLISFFIKGGTATKFAFVKSFTFNPTLPYTLDLCTGQSVVILSNGREYSATIPQDAKYLLLTAVSTDGNTSRLPTNLSIGDWDYVNKDYTSLQTGIVKIGNDTQDLIDTIYDRFTSEPGGAYSDSGVKISTSQELGFTPLIPIQKGQILKYSGQVSEYIHGLLIYSDESTVVDTAFIGGTFDKENYIVTNPNARFVRCQGRNQNFSPELFNPFVEIYTPASSVQENLEKTINERTAEELEIATSQVPYVYADDGSRLPSQNYNGTTDGLIPVSTGDIIVFTGLLPESRHGLLFYSDEDTIVATSLINGTFTNEKVVVENPSIKYFRAQALNANYSPSVTTQLSVVVIKTISTEVAELNERVTTLEESMSVTPDIIIEKVADGAFDVKVKQESNGKYLTHRFLRHRYSRLVRYGTTGEATHEEICSDCWFPSQIYDGTTDILQGNANFINYVANKENEQSYAGEGHGATISDYVHFFADGVEFDPNTLTGRLECGTFRMVEKNVIYAIDTTQPNFNSDNAIPKFDENGNKEVSTIHWLEGVWEKNNTIKYRHRLTIKRDNTQFRYCFGAMLEMEKDNFPHIIINDADGTENLVSYENNQWTCTPINGSSVVLQSDITNKGDEIVGFGTKYIVHQRMLQALTERARISSTFPRLYTGNSYRVKFYQQPIVTTANYAAVGLPTETFDDGDVVELFVERSIEFTD